MTTKEIRFAIISCQQKQYKVTLGDLIYVEKLKYDVGAPFITNKVLLYADEKGTLTGHPYLPNSEVKGTILRHIKDEKKIILKKRRRKNSRRKKGHKQEMTVMQIDQISLVEKES